jgi:hypothetical protein
MKSDKSSVLSMVIAAVVCFAVYLLMRRYVFSDKIETNDYIIAGAVSAGIVIGQLIMNRKK